MPAGIAGIQASMDAPGNIHVNLDFSDPCWNDAIERALFEMTKSLCPVF